MTEFNEIFTGWQAHHVVQIYQYFRDQLNYILRIFISLNTQSALFIYPHKASVMICHHPKGLLGEVQTLPCIAWILSERIPDPLSTGYRMQLSMIPHPCWSCWNVNILCHLVIPIACCLIKFWEDPVAWSGAVCKLQAPISMEHCDRHYNWLLSRNMAVLLMTGLLKTGI